MITKQGVILLILAWVMPVLAMAQNKISGVVTDSETNELLPGTNIVIKNTALGTASDKNGNYTLTGLKDGSYTLRASYSGYETQEVEFTLKGSPVTLDLKLVPTSIDLNAVVVTGTRTEKMLKNSPVLTQAIPVRELLSRDINDITQALEAMVPGIEFNSQAQGKSLSLQGINPQYMLFLVDGERMAGETYGDIDYSRINVADIERIEIVKGASSTLYGSNALGGVINIITKTPNDKASLMAQTRFSSYNTQNYQASFGSKFGKFTSQTSVMIDKTDGYDLIEGDSYRTQEKEDAIAANQHFKFSPNSSLLFEANLSFLNKNRDNTSASLYDRRNRDFTYNLKGSYFINPKNSITLSWNSDNYELSNKITADSLVSDYNNLYNNARLLGSFRLADWNLLTAGAEYESENLTAPRNNIDDKTNTEYVVFAQEDIMLGKNANLIGGFRANNNSQYGWHFTPQVSAMYKIWHFALRANYSMGYKTPTLKEKYMSFRIPAPGPPMFLVGTENLEPESSDYTSLSAEYTREGVSFSVSAYRNHISNMISENLDEYTVKPGGIIEYAYRNYDEVMMKGIDVMLKTKVVNNLLFTGMATFSKKTDEITGNEFKNVRKFTAKLNLDYNYSVKKYRLDLNLQSNFYGGRSIDLMDETTHQVSTIKMDNFSLWKLTSTHTINSKIFIKAGIDNIFDFIDQTGGYNNGTPGRTFFAGLGIRL